MDVETDIEDVLMLAARACSADAAGLWLREGAASRLAAVDGVEDGIRARIEEDPELISTAASLFAAALHAALPSRRGGLWVCSGRERTFGDRDRMALEAAARHAEATLAATAARDQLEAYLRFRSVFEGVDDAVFLKDVEGRYLAINRAGARMLGCTADEVIGRTDLELFDPPSADRVRAMDREVLASGGSRSYESVLDAAGSSGHYVSTKAAFRGPDGKVAGLVGIARDVSDVRRVEAERAELVRKLEAERARLVAVLHQIPSAVAIAEAETGRIALINAQAARLFQFPPEGYAALQDVPIRGYRPDGTPYRRREWPMARSLDAGETVVEEDIEIDRGGERAVLRVSSAPLRDPGGRVEAVVAVFNDVTERRRAEADLREREERLRLAVEAAHLGIWDADLGGGEGALDERHLRLDTADQRIHPDDFRRVAGAVAASRGNGSDLDVEFRALSPGGETRWIASRGRVFRDAAGKPVRMLGVIRDVSAQKEADEEAERVNAFRERLIGIVGHDLRNPLTAIIAASTLLGRLGNLDERQRYAVQRIVSSAARMQRLIADLLDQARARVGSSLPLERTRCDLRDVARQVIDELSMAWPDRAIEVKATGDASGQWDAERLAQVLSNLFANALQHSRQGSQVEVRIDGSVPLVMLAVHSQGDPIPPDLLPAVFDAFQTGGARASRGWGLGLFIVQQIVHAHGGHVGVTSDPRDGTTFTVTLPRALA